MLLSFFLISLIFYKGMTDHSGLRLHMTPTLRQYDVGLLELGVMVHPSVMLPPHFDALTYRGFGMPTCFGQVKFCCLDISYRT